MNKIQDTSGQDVVLDRKPQRRRRLIIAGIVVVILAITATLVYPSYQRYADSDRSVPRSRLRLATVEQGPFVRDISVNGQAVAAVSPTLYSPAAGTVSLNVQAGSLVAQGQVLATVASPDLSSELQQEESTLASLRIALERQYIDGKQEKLRLQQTADLARVRAEAAERELQRAAKSWENQVISRQDYERKQDELAMAKLEYQHAEQDASLADERMLFEIRTQELALERQKLVTENLQRRHDELIIHSPVDGIVGNLQVAQKAAVAVNQPLVTVVDLSALEIELNVPESYAKDLTPGMDLTIQYSNSQYPGMLSAISPEVSNNQVTARARFTTQVPETLKQNQRVSARIVLEAKDNALLVARGPFLENGNGRVAYVVNGQMAMRRPINTGAVSLNQVEILDGLNPGERIIISNTSEFRGAKRLLLTD